VVALGLAKETREEQVRMLQQIATYSDLDQMTVAEGVLEMIMRVREFLLTALNPLRS
jgi:hypothetical protein